MSYVSDHATNMEYMHNPHFFVAVNVSVLPIGSGIGGQVYYLLCSVQLPPQLMAEPSSIVWTKEDNDYQLSSSQQLTFNSLRTSDGGQYTCTVTIETTSGASAHGEASADLVVTSK